MEVLIERQSVALRQQLQRGHSGSLPLFDAAHLALGKAGDVGLPQTSLLPDPGDRSAKPLICRQAQRLLAGVLLRISRIAERIEIEVDI